MQVSKLNEYPLRRFWALSASLEIPEPGSLGGTYRGAFAGPPWVKILVKPALFITGLGGWWGKVVYEDGRAINLVLRKGKLSKRFPMRFEKARSHVDGRDGLSLYYDKDNLLLWLFIVDEIRCLDETTLLGMTRSKIPGLRWLALPFLLEKQS